MLQDLTEISDGKIYGSNDMVKAACQDCAGCHFCCEGMGDTILLDPYDVYRLTTGLGKRFEELLETAIELHVEQGVIVPNLKMNEQQRCTFLDEGGRCSIHKLRPGLCRVFPLGRIYGEKEVSYFLQKDGCKKENKTKIKVSKWLDTPELKRYHLFLSDWHDLKKSAESQIAMAGDEESKRAVNMRLLNLFFVEPYENGQNFYEEFYKRFMQVKLL